MSKVSTYLNFPRSTEQAFNFYKLVFGGEFGGGRIFHFKDMQQQEGMPPLAEEDKNLVMHIELPILESHVTYFGSCTDKFGVQWMLNCTEKAS